MGVPKSEITGWVFTNRIHFYQLWKELKGDRVYVSTSNPDVQVQGFLSNEVLYVATYNTSFDKNPCTCTSGFDVDTYTRSPFSSFHN